MPASFSPKAFPALATLTATAPGGFFPEGLAPAPAYSPVIKHGDRGMYAAHSRTKPDWARTYYRAGRLWATAPLRPDLHAYLEARGWTVAGYAPSSAGPVVILLAP